VREVGTDPATTSPVLKSALKKPVPNSTELLTEAAKGTGIGLLSTTALRNVKCCETKFRNSQQRSCRCISRNFDEILLNCCEILYHKVSYQHQINEKPMGKKILVWNVVFYYHTDKN
jgi:hypothetical protein